MSPETNANDHVPLEFLLGARVKYYYPEPSTANHQRRTTRAKRIFAASIHPRKREERARELLQRVLDDEDSREIDGPSTYAITQLDSDKSDVLKALEAAASTSFRDKEHLFDPDSFHLSFEGSQRSPNRIKSLQQLRDDDLRRQQQRDASFHGYEGSRAFLDIAGAAARIPHTTTRQLRDLKLSVAKAKKKSEDKRTHEMIQLLQEQQVHTRTALHNHQQLSKELLLQKNPRVMATSVLPLDSIEPNGVDARRSVRTIAPLLHVHDPCYDQQWLEEQEHVGRPTLATLTLDPLILPSSPSSEATDTSLHYPSGNNAEDTLASADGGDEFEQIRKRLDDRQREEFANSAANGLFFGGGYIAKKTKDKYRKKFKPKPISNDSGNKLETVLGTQSASILPLAEANPPALRRRKASAGPRRPRIQHHKLQSGKE